ncbi:MAG: M28 family peptidase [Bryobacterales bacterium]|nr:M28 family peptidase [Bryobacterales bacterium]
MKRTILALLGALTAVQAQEAIRGFPPQHVPAQVEREKQVRAIPEGQRIRQYLRHIAADPHLAGTPESQAIAQWAARQMQNWGLDATIEEFEALLPTPKRRVVEMVAPKRFTPKLAEPVIPEDPDSGDKGQLPGYNAYAADGDVTAEVVYVNYGTPDDYKVLAEKGISVKGKIALARYGVSWRGVKPKVAAEHGAVGCLIYSDPREDGYFAGDVFPKGPWRPRDGVQRGSVMDMAVHPGDPLSPGWASEKGGKRLPLKEAATLQKIPVLPISWGDALPILESLEGDVVPEDWRGALPVTYHFGPGPAKIRLALETNWTTRPVHNVIVRIPGAEYPDEWVLYGNHHDAWVSGANDPVSGAASLMETARALGELRKKGWRPKRTIILALWDAEEYGLIGSTEWVEKHRDLLRRNAVAYINSDSLSKGSFGSGGSHTLEQFVAELARDIVDPATKKPLSELRRPKQNAPKDFDPVRDFRITALGSGSDYTAFVHHAGIASLNLGFSGGVSRGVYHSIYDSVAWYERFGDPGFQYTEAFSQLAATALLRLADAPLLPFEFSRLTRTLSEYLTEVGKLPAGGKVALDGPRHALARLTDAARSCDARYGEAQAKAAAARPEALARANRHLFETERAMLRAEGLPKRGWFKHHFYAPGLYTGYGVKTLPGVREAAEAEDPAEANRQAAALAEVFDTLRRKIEETEKALAAL